MLQHEGVYKSDPHSKNTQETTQATARAKGQLIPLQARIDTLHKGVEKNKDWVSDNF